MRFSFIIQEIIQLELVTVFCLEKQKIIAVSFSQAMVNQLSGLMEAMYMKSFYLQMVLI
jgi:hypothetical protein